MTPSGSSPVVGPAVEGGDVAGRRSKVQRPCRAVIVAAHKRNRYRSTLDLLANADGLRWASRRGSPCGRSC